MLNQELANVYALCRQAGIEPILLKGQGVAQNYRHPLHRQCGDIDLYIGKANYDKVNALLRNESTRENEENHKHTSIEWHGVTIENHRILTRLSSPIADKRLQNEINKWTDSSICQRININGNPVTLPPLTFEVAYILMHSTLHFLNEGIGLRQVCDWISLLHNKNKAINKDEVKALLHQFGLSKAARIFGVIAVEYLALPFEDLPIPFTEKDIAKGNWLLNDIWQGGNFGQFDTRRKHRPQGYWNGKWYTFTRALKRCCELGSLAPAEAIWYPLRLITYSIQAQWKKRFGN